VSTKPNEEDRFEQDWKRACAPDSPLNKGVVEEMMADTFVSNHLAAMNPCDHPSLMETHGMLLEKHTAETHPKPHTKLYPILVPSKTVLNGDIPITPIGSDGRRDDVGNDPDWNKKSGKAYWRGRSTGLDHNKGNGAKWRQSHRERLHWLANDKTSKVHNVLAPVGKTGEAQVISYPLRSLGQYYMNAKLITGPWQCNEGDGTCKEMANEIEFAGESSWEESNQYKYIIDVDGNAWSSRFTRLMASLNVVIKSTVFPEWNSHHLPEWFAYVPSKVDYSDLYSILAFFRGTPSGKGAHDEVARRIAVNSQCWVERSESS
jgi:beta-1,2-xylosyltransferase